MTTNLPAENDADEMAALDPYPAHPSRSELALDRHEDALDARYPSRHGRPCADFLAALYGMGRAS